MQFKEYVLEVLKTESNDFTKINARMGKERNIRLLHATMGSTTEVGELFEMLTKPSLDRTNLREEVGDVLWYLGVAVHELQIDPDQFMAKVLSGHKKLGFFEKLSVISTLRRLISKSTMASCQMLDIMKKGVFYGPKEGKPELDVERMEALMVELFRYMMSILEIANFKLEGAMDVNITKLQKKRFKSGKFTETEATDRNLAEELKALQQKE